MEQNLTLKGQKEFIENFINSIMEDKFSFEEIETNLNNINNLIKERGIIFSYFLLSENFFDAIIKLFFEDNLTELVLKVVKNIFEAFNVNMLYNNPTYIYENKLKEFGICPELENVRNEKTEIEILFDKVSSLKSDWEDLRNISENSNEGEDYEFIYYNSLKERFTDCIHSICDLNKNYNNYVIDFFQELITKIDNFRKVKFKDPINIDNNNNNNKNNNNTNNLDSIETPQIVYNINEIPLNSDIKKTELKNRTFFYLNEKLKFGEDLQTEFKQYTIPFNKFQREEIKKQYCAMLNSIGGRIYLGITDDKIVKGIFLNYKKRDLIRNDLINYTYDFYPKCRTKKIDILFIPIKNMKKNKFQNNLYVIKIIVHQGDTDKLYSISSKCYISYLRLPGQCANLTAAEISEEIIQRNKNPKNPINSLEFNDPQPEEILSESSLLSNKSIQNNLININNDYNLPDKNNTNFGKNININYINNNGRKLKNFKDFIVVKVKGIGSEITSKDLDDIFQNLNYVTKKFFVYNNGSSRGYGYLNFSSLKDALSAIDKYDRMKFKNSIIRLSLKDENFEEN
jgi:hypothetical protein